MTINHPPHFIEALNSLRIGLNQSLTYNFPPFVDEDPNDAVKLTVDSVLPAFLRF